MPEVSLVIPCRNEAARLPGTLQELTSFLGVASFSSEVVIVVERSEDATAELVSDWERQEPRFRAVLNPVARGKGYAVKTGMLAAEGDVVFFMDADLSVPLRFLGPFLAEIESGADVVMGSRRHPETVIACSQPISRVVAGRAFNIALRFCGATRFRDTQCGFKAFTRNASHAIFSRMGSDGFGFDVEVLAHAHALGFKVVEHPVEWRDVSGSKVRPLRDGARAFAEALAGARRAKKSRAPQD